MSPRYLYAILGAAPSAPSGAGMTGEPLRLVECDGLFAAAGEMAETPAVTPDALRGHDRVVQRLAALADAVLPPRFGAVASDDADLCDRIRRAPGALREELERRTAGLKPARWNADPEEVQRSVARLVLTPNETEKLGVALMRLEETVVDLSTRFGLKPEALNLDLGPLGRLR